MELASHHRHRRRLPLDPILPALVGSLLASDLLSPSYEGYALEPSGIDSWRHNSFGRCLSLLGWYSLSRFPWFVGGGGQS